jgi:hypothetical protein
VPVRGVDLRVLFGLGRTAVSPNPKPNDDDDDVYLRLQHGKDFHNLVYMSHINPAKRHK